ncbi:MAG TPA: phosphoethanolamine transferase [Burkholderiaceae bacterium]|nr:phosphoethanolamine transferase [Burkholderiaceae bacterium]
MFSLLRPANLLVLVTYLALSAVPFIPLLTGGTAAHPVRLASLELFAWVAAWAVFKRPAWFHWMLIPAFFALPVELYLRTYYNQGISTHHLGVIAETSPKEALEFLGGTIWLLLAIALGISAWAWLTWKAVCRTRDLDWVGKSRWVTLGLVAIVLCTWFYGREFGVRTADPSSPSNSLVKTSAVAPGTKDQDDGEPVIASAPPGRGSTLPDLPKLPAWARMPFDSDSFGTTWPFGLAVQGYDFWKERAYLSDLAQKSSLFKFGARQASQADLPQVLVMVIGESSRYDRWSLNGYKRETNPLLKNEPNLISLSNVVTAVSATRLSVPVLVSRKPAMQSLKAGFSEKSFLSAFREAGFKAYWLSNQMSFGQYDTPVSVYANEADVTQFLNLGGFTDNSSHDQVLLEPLKKAIADPSSKKLIVLHTLGNHWNYSQRHPMEYDKWQPSLFGTPNPAYTDLKLKQQLNNSYDNSILYTDWFLSQVIAALKSSSQLSSMMYVSDHGQTLYDGSCKLAFHGHNTQYEFHVPALVWYSDAYQSAYPDKISRLQRHKRARLATENIFHSLLDMADIRYGTEQLERSFFSKNFRPHKRYVDSYGWTDYDNATFKGDCREVIDNGKPLLQEQ